MRPDAYIKDFHVKSPIEKLEEVNGLIKSKEHKMEKLSAVLSDDNKINTLGGKNKMDGPNAARQRVHQRLSRIAVTLTELKKTRKELIPLAEEQRLLEEQQAKTRTTTKVEK